MSSVLSLKIHGTNLQSCESWLPVYLFQMIRKSLKARQNGKMPPSLHEQSKVEYLKQHSPLWPLQGVCRSLQILPTLSGCVSHHWSQGPLLCKTIISPFIITMKIVTIIYLQTLKSAVTSLNSIIIYDYHNIKL